VTEGVTLNEQSTDQVVIEAPIFESLSSTLTLKQLSSTLLSALRQLFSAGATERELSGMVMESDGLTGMYKLKFYLGKLAQHALLCHTLLVDQQAIAKIVPLAPGYEFRSGTVDPETKYALSRFAYCRREKAEIVLESPLGYAQVKLYDARAVAMLFHLSQPCNCRELAAAVSGLTADAVSQFLNLLLSAQAVWASPEDGSLPEDTNPALAQWEFHDLLFHSRSRMGRHNNPWGKSYRFEGKIAPLPPVKPKMSNEAIPLYKPDLEQLRRTDAPFTQVLEQRKSIREMADQPITGQALGEFLYRAARVKEVYHDDKGGVTFRPFPGGGALHELEIYPLIDRCTDIPSGLYHYEPLEHQLSKVADRTRHAEILLDMAWAQIKQASRPPVLLIIAARFQRLQWKYSSISYALILKDVGCLYQTMYLVATAMGLAPCALGGGNSDLFALAAGLDYYAETDVGAFILGIPAASDVIRREPDYDISASLA
jgi:SagB-type dehydrogenase family enzyme